MAPPSSTPERDPLNPMAREQKKVRSVMALTALTLCRGTVPIYRRFTRSTNSDFFAFQRVHSSTQQREQRLPNALP